MNNWHLLLLAVIAILQPIGSFTERNLIDGRQECCDHRSNSITQNTRLYGPHRKITPEERRLSSQEDIREERRYESRNNDPITRSRERLIVERAERQVSPESAFRFSTETRITRNQEHSHRSAETTESRHTRQKQSRRTREDISGDSIDQYEGEILGSRRIKMSRDDTRPGRIGNERLHRESVDSRDARRVRDSEDLHRLSTNKETIAVLRRQRDDVAQNAIRRDYMISSLRAVNKLQLDNNRERRSLDRRTRDNADENKHPRSPESRVNEREELRSPTDLRQNSRSTFRPIFERIGDHRRDQNREFRDRTSAVLRDSSERISADHRREFRDTFERFDRSRKDTKQNHNNERFDERRQQRDNSRLFREKSTILRERRTDVEQMRISMRSDERREATRNILPQRSRDSTGERKQESRVSRMLEATHDERLVRSDGRRDERRQPSTRSLDRVSVRSSRVSDDLMEREYNSRNSARFPDRIVRDDRAARYRRDVRSVERLDERREQRDENRMTRDRTIAKLRETKENSERRQEARRTASLSRFEINSRSEREFKINRDLRDNIRFDVNRRNHEEHRASREQNLHRMDRNSERRKDALTRTSRFTERASSDERTSRIRKDIRGGRSDLYSDIRDLHQAIIDSDRTIFIQRLTHDVFVPQPRDDTHRTSRNTEANARLQSTQSLKYSRDERREVRERDEIKVSRDRISITQLLRERTRVEDEKRETTRDSRVKARNEVIRNREDVRMGERLEVRRQQDESRSTDRVSFRQPGNILAAQPVVRRSQKIASPNAKIQSERLSRNRDDRTRRQGRDNIRVFRAAESRHESRRMIEKNVQPNQDHLGTERRANQHRRIEDKQLRYSEIFLDKEVQTATRRDAIDASFRSFEAKIREIEPVDETSDNQNAMTWQMLFYTLQGAYLCGLLMQVLTEKSNKGKPRYFSGWLWAASSKDLVKVE